MKRGLVVLTAAALAAVAGGVPKFEYAGMWGKSGTGPGEFYYPFCVATAPGGNVYVTDGWPVNERVQYFTPTGSFLGQWSVPGVRGVDVAPNGNVYVIAGGIKYFTSTGSLIGSWSGLIGPMDVAVAPNGNVYVVELEGDRVSYFTAAGSLLGRWGKFGTGAGEFYEPAGVAVAPNGVVYVAERGNHRIQYFTPNGSFLAMWGKNGDKPGEFDEPNGVDVSNSGIVFVANTYNYCVDYFTTTGSWLGIFGGPGEGPGRFYLVYDVAVSPSDTRVYVPDYLNDRVQYFDQTNAAVEPSSLGRVKALFN